MDESINDFKTINKPYLIQRGSFRNIKNDEIVGLDSLISYDYMGSAEFEFGALPQSLTRICESLDQYEVFPTITKNADGQCLYIFCRKSQAEEIFKCVLRFSKEEYSQELITKERVGLYSYINCKSEFDLRINFWWDVTEIEYDKLGNDWMICFGDNITRLIIAINKVCTKKNIKFQKELPKLMQTKISDINIEIVDDYKVIKIIYPTSKSISIVKRNIIKFEETDSSKINVTVKTNKGQEKLIIVDIPRSSIREIFLNKIKQSICSLSCRTFKKT
ncbi:MAG: hypothetical protein PHF86_10980 [Candidatus Nanoarchaeia archaeon]|jgi:hypothetical protein|nr:hypothetical protein [Candidatus Nanoarchaeia archaeon]